MTDADTPIGSFAVVQPCLWTENRYYRLYITPEELVGVWTGKAKDIARVFAAQGGLVRGLLAGAAGNRQQDGRIQELATKPFEQLRADHEHNFAARLNDVAHAEIAIGSIWFRLNWSSIAQVGLLHISLHSGQRLRFAVPTNDDMRAAIDLVKASFGPTLRVGLAWDEGRKRYRRT
ncbi:MAG: hypothetical protein K8T25_13065 [Planctomycetia bacterium]|nr:hypothetical protein [Planctomycetia bacterium]